MTQCDLLIDTFNWIGEAICYTVAGDYNMTRSDYNIVAWNLINYDYNMTPSDYNIVYWNLNGNGVSGKLLVNPMVIQDDSLEESRYCLCLVLYNVVKSFNWISSLLCLFRRLRYYFRYSFFVIPFNILCEM